MRRVRLARAPNRFGDFFNAPPTLSFVVPLIVFPSGNFGSSGPPEVLSPMTGFVQNPNAGRRPQTENFRQLQPYSSCTNFVLQHYCHNLFTARLQDDNGGPTTGGVSARESIFVTTVGAEFTTADAQTSLEVRLPLIHAASTSNTLVDGTFGTVASRISSRNPVGNLSLINFGCRNDESSSFGGNRLMKPFDSQDISKRRFELSGLTRRLIIFPPSKLLQNRWLRKLSKSRSCPAFLHPENHLRYVTA